MNRLIVNLDEDEREAIVNLAETEKRGARDQAAMLIRMQLEALNLLPARKTARQPRKQQAAQA